MIKLSDTQRILLATACQREDGSVLPLPGSVHRGGGATKALAALLRRAMLIELPTTNAAAIHRTDGDLTYGLFITKAGMAAIGIDDDIDAEMSTVVGELPAVVEVDKAPTKIALVLELLASAEGVPVTEPMAATGWQPHTTRAALTGLRKKGHSIQRIKRDSITCYRVLEAV